jgi:hypothetical protein
VVVRDVQCCTVLHGRVATCNCSASSLHCCASLPLHSTLLAVCATNASAMNQTGERRRTRSTDIASPGTLSPPPPSKWTPSLPQATTTATVPGRTPLEEGGRGGGRTQTTKVHRARERRRTPWLWQQIHSIPLIERLLYVIGFSLITFALICATMLPVSPALHLRDGIQLLDVQSTHCAVATRGMGGPSLD